jgi:Fe-S cluster assembly protein SufB
MKSEQTQLNMGVTPGAYKYGFADPENEVFRCEKGLTETVVSQISEHKNEPQWMREFRLRALKIFWKKPMPNWGPDLSSLDFTGIYYYIKPVVTQGRTWADVPDDIKRTFDKLGIPEAERKFLAGVGAQYDSEVVYHNIKEDLAKKGVIFTDPETAVLKYPELVRQYFGTVIPPTDNKFAALNSAVWSGGSFIYVPPGVKVDIPLQAYFRINAKNMGQFERTLIIADEGSFVHYVEGCVPPDGQVSTGSEWINIENVRPGDKMMNGEGHKTEVRSARARDFDGELIEIVPVSSGNTLRLTPEHPVLAVKREWVMVKRQPRHTWLAEVDSQKLCATEPQYIPAGELAAGDFLIFPVCKGSQDDPRYTPELMKLLGYYLAEGCAYVHSTLNMPVVAFSLGSHEPELIGEIRQLVEKITDKKTYAVSDKKKHGVTVSVYSQKLMELCVEACGKHAAEKKLSKKIMELPAAKQKYLLDAYLLGDGSVYRQGRHMVRASTASRQLAQQLQELFARQGIYATISVRRGGQDHIQGRAIVRRDQYILYYSLNKKHSPVRFHGDYFLVPIRRINKKPYRGTVFNFEVTQAPNSYLVSGFAVHNCTAPTYSSDSLHSAVVEIIAKKGARVQYSTIQNWSGNVYNLVTKRAVAHEEATVEWVDGNIGSKITQKYPAVYLVGRGAHGEVLSVAFAGKGQIQDTGGKMIHAASDTTSTITSKSISKDGGQATYRGLVKVYENLRNIKSNVVCDALILDDHSRSDTYPVIENSANDVSIEHEARVSKISEEQLFYLMSRGMGEREAAMMIVNGFLDPLIKKLPMEYAVEMNRLIEMEMEGSVG